MLRYLSYILLFLWLPVSAQIVVKPLQYNSLQAEYAAQHKRMKTAATDSDTIQIPFVEDFVNSSIVPNDSLWMPGGGTFINNSYPLNHPNYNVATFDGLNAAGVPYSNNLYATGKTDSLISRPINLGPDSIKSPVYFRFFYQAGGLGEIPDEPSDSLTLQFKTQSGNWITVKNIVNIPETNSSSFGNFVLIPVTDPQYLYNGFQFRFQSYGKQSGNYDVWNIDYIRLDTGVIANVNWAPDFSYRSTSPSMLKRYTAMPVWQYEAAIADETIDQLRFEAVNLRDSVFGYGINETKSFLRELNTGSTTQNFPATEELMHGRETKSFSYSVNKSNIVANGLPKKFEYRSTVKGVDPVKGDKFDFGGVVSSKESNYNYQLNDTIKSVTLIRDYYSYDDGTAESGIGVNQAYGRIAVKYTLNIPDTLLSVRINFPNVGKDYKGSPIYIIVWRGSLSNDSIIYSENFLVKQGPNVNGFYEYTFKDPVYIKGNKTDIYIGIQQSVNDIILVGFDRNIDNRDKIYFNVKSTWSQYSEEAGSIMIHPYFRKALITGTKQPKVTIDANVFPNPSQGEFTIQGKIKTATVYDLSGREVFATQFEDDDIFNDHPLNLSHLNNGLYLLHLENSMGKVVKKIYINR